MSRAPEFWHHHAGISVPDLEQAIAWYQQVLGFELQFRSVLPSANARVAFLKNGDQHIELFEVDGAQPLPAGRRVPDEDLRTHGNKHVCFGVDNIAAFSGAMKDRGADIVWVKVIDADKAVMFIRDLAGNLIEFMQAPRPAGSTSRLAG